LIRGALAVRAVRHGLLTTGLVLVTCGVVAALAAATYATVDSHRDRLTGRGEGEITRAADSTVEVRWPLPSGEPVVSVVALDVTPYPVGTRTQVAYDPARPEDAVIPGASLLAEADRALSGVIFPLIVAVGVLGIGAWRIVTRARLTRRVPGTAPVRRVLVQRGLSVRSWLEVEGAIPRWVPVYFDPALVSLPSPAEVPVYGDVANDRLVAFQVGKVVLYPSGPVSSVEPKGRRIDNPARPDAYAADRAAAISRPLRQLRVDSAAVVAAPVVGIFWSFVDRSGLLGWLGATLVTAAVALWWGALRGSDPS
jgi:hypothetical protein